jgi:RNA polymerase sigma factor for flagellar operon FliA
LPEFIELDDLIAYGQMGLVEAAQGFDAQRGSQFATFAYYRVRGAIYDGLSKMNWVSRSQYQQIRQEQLGGDVLAVEASSGDPSADSTLDDDVQWLKRTAGSLAVVQLMTRSGEDTYDDEANLADPHVQPPSMEASSRETAAALRQLIDQLPADAAALVRGVYFEGLTIQEAGERIGVSKAWASRLHAKTLDRLGRSLRRLGVTDSDD